MINQQQGKHGLHCPECQSFIPLTVERLLGGRPLFCMDCGLKIEINMERSAPALDALRRVKTAIKKAEEDIKKAQDPHSNV